MLEATDRRDGTYGFADYPALPGVKRNHADLALFRWRVTGLRAGLVYLPEGLGNQLCFQLVGARGPALRILVLVMQPPLLVFSCIDPQYVIILAQQLLSGITDECQSMFAVLIGSLEPAFEAILVKVVNRGHDLRVHPELHLKGCLQRIIRSLEVFLEQ
ncbi:hypothetical protein D3C86_1679690 [compost metagenome]